MTETPATSTPAKRRIGVRSIAAVIALILGLGLLPLGTVTYWGHRTVTDTERYLETMQPLAYDEDVQNSLSVFITDKIEEQIDPEALVNQLFAGLIEEYPSLKALVPIVSGAVDSLIAQVVDHTDADPGERREIFRLRAVGIDRVEMEVFIPAVVLRGRRLVPAEAIGEIDTGSRVIGLSVLRESIRKFL